MSESLHNGDKDVKKSGGKTESLTALLKSHGADLSTVKANKILIEIGILEQKERESTAYKGKFKKFKVLTDTGLKYGVNRESFNNPEESSPYYFTSEFPELLALMLKNV